jgi:glycosyltransferase involved in cell wall biosynthesis
VRAARRADVVHVHGDMAAVLSRPALAGRPTLMTTHGLHFLRRSEGLRARAFAAALKGALGRCVRVLCTSHAERDELMHLAVQESIRVVHNAVPPRLGAERDREQERSAFGVGGDVVALFAGQLEERKQPLLAARAAISARRRGARLVLLVAGVGPQAAELGELAGDAVRPLGHSDRLDALYAAADLFFAPAEREGLSYALLEAMDAGLAIVASDGPGNPEAVGEAGVLFPAGDEAALAQALTELAGDPQRRADLGAAARERARTEFGEEAFAAAIREAYAAAQTSP